MVESAVAGGGSAAVVPIGGLKHRPEIDGLRAIAVLVVALYHGGLGFSGGYVGVDVFFVISGYLITSLIWKDLEAGTFTFSHFWERRARRIVPAMVVVVAATIAIGCIFLFPVDLQSLGRATASQSIFAANFNYWQEAGYFGGAAEEKPLVHTWSLAVEEQFYLFMPFIAWGAFRGRRTRTRRGAMALFSGLLALSLGLGVYGVSRFPSAAFYLLPTRAWELLSGAVLALAPPAIGFLRSRLLKESAALLGLASILVASLAYTPSTRFPGAAALLPCAGAWLVIWANGRSSEDEGLPLVGRLLSARPVVFIGLVSYSFYLWHWPFLTFIRYISIDSPPAYVRLLAIIAGFLCAILSWKFIEKPFREKRIASGRSIFVFAALGLLALFACGISIYKASGLPGRFPAAVVEYANAKDDLSFRINLDMKSAERGELTPLGGPSAAPSWLIWGDSHAMSMLPAFDFILKAHGLAGLGATHSSTPPILSWYFSDDYGLNDSAPAFGRLVLKTASIRKISDVVLVAYWGCYSEYANRTGSYQAYCDGLLDTVKAIKALGMRAWLVLDIPTQDINVPRVLSRAFLMRKDITDSLRTVDEVQPYDGFSEETISAFEREGARLINPKPLFLDPTGRYYRVEKDGIALYWDNQHLSTKCAERVVAPFLEKALGLD